jgi:cell division initiation protein
MITPLDIQNKTFGKGVRGYKEDEVDGFLDLIIIDYEKALSENRELKTKLKDAMGEIEKYKNSESTVMETIETARALMRDISGSAEKRAEIVLKNAELDAERIVREASESGQRLNEEYQALKNRYTIFSTRFKSLLESEIDKFDTLSQELFYEDGIRK